MRLIKIIVVVFFVILVIIFFARDSLAKLGFSYYLDQRLGFKTSVAAASFSRSGLALRNISLFGEGFNLTVPYFKIKPKILAWSGPKVIELIVKDCLVTISKVKALGDNFKKEASTKPGLEKAKPESWSWLLKIYLQDIDLSINDSDFDFKGVFSGELWLGFESGSLVNLGGQFNTSSAGNINIKKDDSFDLFKGYLDRESQATLLEAFKNYSYQRGLVILERQAKTLRLELDFDSLSSGQRKVTLNLHDIFN